MVVLAVSIITKSGKVLVSRQFVKMSRERIESLLAAFPQLVLDDKQHNFVEADEVRYVYQLLEGLYLLLVTNKSSNIIEDLDTLELLSKLVPEYSHSLIEEEICKSAFELISAFDEALSLGNKEIVNVAQVKQYCEMESVEENLHKMLIQSKINETKDVMRRKALEIHRRKIEELDKGGFVSVPGSRNSESSFSDTSISSSESCFAVSSGADTDSLNSFSSQDLFAKAPPKEMGMQLVKGKKEDQFLESLQAEGWGMREDVPASNAAPSKLSVVGVTEPITLTIEERLNVAINSSGGLKSFDVQGTLFLHVLNQEDGFIQVQIENKDIPGLCFNMCPNINEDLFHRERILALKDLNSSFPTGQSDFALLKWRIQNLDESSLPLTVICWPSVSGNATHVNIEYEASYLFTLQNVVISIPLPVIHDAPNVTQIDGEWRYDLTNSVVEWSVQLIDDSNRSGSMELVMPLAGASSFSPISISFTAANTYSGVRVAGLHHLRGEVAPKYTQRMELTTDSYQVV